MKKKTISLFLALSLVLTATACGTQQTTDTSTPPKDIPTEQTNSTNEPSNNQTEETSTEQTEEKAEI